MTARDMALAALTSMIWGFAFVTYRFGLDVFSPAQLTALRFVIGALPIVFVPRPRVAWSRLILIGLFLFAGQFLLLFLAFAQGMPAGLASVTQQMQAFFTVLLVAVIFRELPTRRQLAGMTVAFTGLVLIGLTTGADLNYAVLGLALAAAFSWAIGNVLVRQTREAPTYPLMVWASLVPPLPVLLVSSFDDKAMPVLQAVGSASWLAIGTLVYLGTLGTSIAYAIWGSLLRRYPAPVVAPFALLSPVTGVLASALIFGERFGALRSAGMALILCGLAVVLLPVRWRRDSRAAPSPAQPDASRGQ
jgi:O-acetylserine/cysteine efflux transporter